MKKLSSAEAELKKKGAYKIREHFKNNITSIF